MSRELWRRKGELPSGTLFFGGEDRGMCIQLTSGELGDEHFGYYLSFSVKVLSCLIKKLQKVEKELKEVENEY